MSKKKKIEVEKMKVNMKLSIKTFVIMVIFALGLLTIMTGALLKTVFNVKDYDKLSAEITNIDVEGYYSEGTLKHGYFISLEYNYKAKAYVEQEHVAFRFDKKEGQEINIYVNPKKPTSFVTYYDLRAMFLGEVFSIILFILTIKAYITRKKTKIK